MRLLAGRPCTGEWRCPFQFSIRGRMSMHVCNAGFVYLVGMTTVAGSLAGPVGELDPGGPEC